MRYRMGWCWALVLVLGVAWPNALAQESGKHLFILSGQSNMRKPLPESFRDAVSAVFGADNVIVVTHAHPSQPIRQWYKDWTPPEGMEADDKPNGQLYNALMGRVKKAIEGKTIDTVTFIWMQGEADAGKGWGSVYEKSFLGVLDQIKKDLNRQQINFVIGRINDYWLPANGTKDGDVVRAVQKKLGEEHANGDWVNTDDLNMGVNPWGGYEVAGGHFPPSAYVVLGKRFAHRAVKLIDPALKYDESIFAERFMDTPDDLKTHAAIGKPVALSPAPENKLDLAMLTDGKFGGTEPKPGEWLAVAPKTTNVGLVVDLGSEQEIDGIAVNLLINKGAKAGFPTNIDFDISSDGETYRPMQKRGKKTGVWFGYRDAQRQQWNEQLKPQAVLVLLDKQAKARYIKITVKTAESWAYIDEIAVSPEANAREGQ